MKDLFIRLAASNELAKQYAERLMGKRKYRDFRKVLAQYASGRPIDGPNQVMIDSIPAVDLAKMLDVEELREIFVEKAKYLATKVANNVTFKFTSPSNNCDMGNLRGQAQVFLLYAIYGYDNPEIKFSTYAYHVVKNELDRYVLMQHTGLSSNSMDMVEAKRDWLRAERDLHEQAIAPSFHNIAEHLGCGGDDQNSKRARQKLMGVMASVGSISNDHDGDELSSQDSCLSRAGTEMYEDDQRERSAEETCDFIETQVLASATERTIFREMRQGVGLTEAARKIGMEVKEARKVFEKIKLKTRRYYAAQERAA